ncbi:MAG: hypothetical protein ABJ013_04530 [Halioglobus sp.]
MSLLPSQASLIPGLTLERGDPASRVAEHALAVGDLLAVEFELEQYWLEGAPSVALVALYAPTSAGTQLVVTDQALVVTESSVDAQFQAWAEQGQCAVVEIGAALPLTPVVVDKPWGREIWFSGIEQRGLSGVRSTVVVAPQSTASADGVTPIPWLQAAMPDVALGGRDDLVLLKILDPVSEPVVGDLYFELHQRKREVYVVTHVDTKAWPDGVGYMRYGFDPQKIDEAGSPDAFKQQYLAAVLSYESTRREIDTLSTDPDETLLERERRERESMDSFSAYKSLRVGDVVRVPLQLPHSLLHGVRTIEFQTPVYERMILSFAQRVLTQPHWDTEAALASMQLLPPQDEPAVVVNESDGVLVQQIVDFDEFYVLRFIMEAGSSVSLPASPVVRVGMAVVGQLLLDGQVLAAEEAVLVPRNRVQNTVLEASIEGAVFLLAIPAH